MSDLELDLPGITVCFADMQHFMALDDKLKEAQARIEELEKAPLPDDVAKIAAALRANAKGGIPDFANSDLMDAAADMIERLGAVNKEQFESLDHLQRLHHKRIEKMQARIDENEARINKLETQAQAK